MHAPTRHLLICQYGSVRSLQWIDKCNIFSEPWGKLLMFYGMMGVYLKEGSVLHADSAYFISNGFWRSQCLHIQCMCKRGEMGSVHALKWKFSLIYDAIWWLLFISFQWFSLVSSVNTCQTLVFYMFWICYVLNPHHLQKKESVLSVFFYLECSGR